MRKLYGYLSRMDYFRDDETRVPDNAFGRIFTPRMHAQFLELLTNEAAVEWVEYAIGKIRPRRGWTPTQYMELVDRSRIQEKLDFHDDIGAVEARNIETAHEGTLQGFRVQYPENVPMHLNIAQGHEAEIASIKGVMGLYSVNYATGELKGIAEDLVTHVRFG